MNNLLYELHRDPRVGTVVNQIQKFANAQSNEAQTVREC